MSFSVNSFLSKTEQLGSLAKKHKFSVSLTPPPGTNLPNGKIDFLCKKATLPARTFATTEDRMYGYALSVPYETTYENVTLSFHEVNQFEVRKFFETWMEYINPQDTYNVRYYDDYKSEVNIYVYDDELSEPDPTQSRYSVKLFGAYPATISSIDIDWGDMELMEFDVDISYSKWKSSVT